MWRKEQNCELNNTLKKFPNLTDLSIIIYKGQDDNDNTKLIIEEEKDCKITNLTFYLKLINTSVKICCSNYENLKYINLEINEKISNLEDCLPIFNNNCNTIFQNLTAFKLKCNWYRPIESSVLNNLYNNIEKMPNLKYFHINCSSKNLQVDFITKFLDKILSLKLTSIYFLIKENPNIKKEPFIKNINTQIEDIKLYDYITI